jgi:hypothetical protein
MSRTLPTTRLAARATPLPWRTPSENRAYLARTATTTAETPTATKALP